MPNNKNAERFHQRNANFILTKFSSPTEADVIILFHQRNANVILTKFSSPTEADVIILLGAGAISDENLNWQRPLQAVTTPFRQSDDIYVSVVMLLYHTHHWYIQSHDGVIKWKNFPRYWPVVRGIHRLPVNSQHIGQWPGALMFSSIFAWIDGWVNNREAGNLRRHRAHYDVTVMDSDTVRSYDIACSTAIQSGSDTARY